MNLYDAKAIYFGFDLATRTHTRTHTHKHYTHASIFDPILFLSLPLTHITPHHNMKSNIKKYLICTVVMLVIFRRIA